MTQHRFFWQDAKLRSHYRNNVIVGIVIALGFWFSAGTQWGEGVRNLAFDLLVRVEYHFTHEVRQGENPMYFVEITPDQYQRWGEPLLTPRDKMADLIEAAWKKEAPVLVLDVLLDRPDREHPVADAKLRLLLDRMLRDNARMQVIFPVRIGADGDLRSHLLEDFFERKTADGRRLFYPAVPTVLASEDLLHRFWEGYQVCRDRLGHARIVWSVPLLAATLHDGHQERLEQMAKKLLAGVGHAAGAGDDSHGAELQLELGAGELQLAPLERAMLPGGDHPVYRAGESHGLTYAQRVRFLIPPETQARRDAENFRPGMSPDSLAGKIVVIGNSSPETGDILATPVGRIPGMYLVGNAINTIVTDRMPSHMNHWLDLALEAFIIVVAAWFFLRYHTFLAQIGSTAIFLAILAPFSWYVYRHWGWFFNFIVPVVGMRLHSIADSCEAMVAVRGRKNHDHH
jgi:CHASE2 domain-containing sensor protein